MKNKKRFMRLLFMGVFLLFAIGCEKDDDNDINGQEFVDADGNVYETVTIGDLVWMAENLKTTTYNDGTDIPNVTDDDAWSELETGAYTLYDHDLSNKDVYGALYNWYAVETGNLCPDGWRVPTDEEWQALESKADSKYGFGDEEWEIISRNNRGNDAGLNMKATFGWDEDGDGTDAIGFSGLPGGYRNNHGHYYYEGSMGIWWTATEFDKGRAYDRSLRHNHEDIGRFPSGKRIGYSVRCVREK